MQSDTPLVEIIRDYLVRLSALEESESAVADSSQPLTPDSSPGPALWPRTRVTTEESAALIDRFEPFAELLYLMARSDGAIDNDETSVVIGALRALTNGKVSSHHRAEIQERMEARVAGRESEARMDLLCAQLSLKKSDAELALTLASAVAVADHEVSPEESDFLSQLAINLGLSSERARELLQGCKISLAQRDAKLNQG
ncbi:MAG: TerB family tellurite resistance protein [Polyangiaceae bacterium]|nr:TerB family tellurite resistance protein [Polyangiaceae bacterium]